MTIENNKWKFYEMYNMNEQRTVWHRITKFYSDIHTYLLYNRTGYDNTWYFRLWGIEYKREWWNRLISLWQNGDTPWHLACKYGHLSVMTYLLQQKIDLNAQNKVRTQKLSVFICLKNIFIMPQPYIQATQFHIHDVLSLFALRSKCGMRMSMNYCYVIIIHRLLFRTLKTTEMA